ncbi:LRR and PYD domains-containing 3-like protein [Labeo rohita]|uniref:LRR and PYD domains-containing 3-like protein n=1 Tax=Labeo rohita TaxID=84645 RepID=A0A498M3I7_LABRO|nr:LRR and PYD domains-containing 3-like protein [Labeo rohita]
MEKADIFDTVDKMVECFGPEQSIEVMLDILRKMNQNDLAEQLKNKSKQAQAEGNMKKSVTVGGGAPVGTRLHVGWTPGSPENHQFHRPGLLVEDAEEGFTNPN